MVEIKMNGKELAKALRERIERYKGRGSTAVKRGCLVLEAEAKRRAPVDDGTLRRSITHRVIERDGEIVGQVGTNVHYAIHVEYGHRTRLGKGIGPARGTIAYVPGRFFLTNAMRAKRDTVRKVVLTNLQKEDGV